MILMMRAGDVAVMAELRLNDLIVNTSGPLVIHVRRSTQRSDRYKMPVAPALDTFNLIRLLPRV